MDDLKSLIDKTLEEVFTKAKDLKINELEFGLRNFWEIPNISRSKDPTYGVMLFDRLTRVLKKLNYKMIGPKYELVISKVGHDIHRATLSGQQNIQAFCENPDDKKVEFYYETKTREQTDADSDLEKEYGLRLRMSAEEKKDASGFGWVRDSETAKTFRYRKRYTFEVPIRAVKKSTEEAPKGPQEPKGKEGPSGPKDKEEPKGSQEPKGKEGPLLRSSQSEARRAGPSGPKDSEGLKEPQSQAPPQEKQKPLGTINIDLSIYKEGTGVSFTKATTKSDKRFMLGPETYDIEIEYQPAKKNYVEQADLKRILDLMIEPVYHCLQMSQDSPIIMSNSGRRTILDKYLKLIGKTAKDSFVGANVYPMGIHNVLPGQEFIDQRIKIDDYVFTIKADGVRNLLFIDDNSDCYLIDMNHEVRTIGLKSLPRSSQPAITNSILDVELIVTSHDRFPENDKYQILAFDALFYNNEDIRKRPLFSDTSKTDKNKKTPRFELTVYVMTELNKQVSEKALYNFEPKIYYRTPHYKSTSSTSTVVSKTKESSHTLFSPEKSEFSQYLNPLSDLVYLEKNYNKEGKYPKDGIILTQIFAPYPSKSDENAKIFSLKVKNLDQLSIDFLYRPTNEKVPGAFGESLKYSLWIQRTGIAPFRPIYSVYPNYNTANVPMIKQTERTSQRSENTPQAPEKAKIFQINEPEQPNIINTVMRTMTTDGEPDDTGFLIFPDFVYESIYKREVGWIPTRHRPIKTVQNKPNYYLTANSTWEMILNILENPTSIGKTNIIESIGEITEDNLIQLMERYLKVLEETKKPITFEDWLARNLSKPKNYYNSNLESIWEQNAAKNPIILPMSQMHNQVKSLLYQATAKATGRSEGLRLLELASGKSPDYIRWIKNGIDHVVGIEIDPIQIDAAVQRYEDEWKRYKNSLRSKSKLPKPIQVEYLQGDMTENLRSGAAGKTPEDQEKLRNLFQSGAGRSQFDIVSCQFAMHFAMKDEETFTKFIKNVSQNLRLGGFFIGTSFIATRTKEEQQDPSIGPGVHDRLKAQTAIATATTDDKQAKTVDTKQPKPTDSKQPKTSKQSKIAESAHDLSYIDPKTGTVLWTIDKGENFEPELKDFGQDILVYLSTLHQEKANKEYLVNLTSEKAIEIATRFNLKLIKLPDSLIGNPDRPQAFGDVYNKLQNNEIKPIDMKLLGKPIDVKTILKQLLKDEKLAEFSRFNSLFVFQKIK